MFDPLVTILYNKGEMDTAGNRKSHRSNRHVPQNRFIFASKATALAQKSWKAWSLFPSSPRPSQGGKSLKLLQTALFNNTAARGGRGVVTVMCMPKKLGSALSFLRGQV